MATADRSPESWHALEVAETAARLATDPVGGLAPDEAMRRLATFGPNVIEESPRGSRWRRFLLHFGEPVIWILVVAAILAGLLGEWADATAILAIVLVNGLIGYLQEERTEQAISALKSLAMPRATVVRKGVVVDVPACEVVPGDRIQLEAGDHVPADARLVETHALSTQEAVLTGESVPTAKDALARLAPTLPLGDRTTLVHAGTVVASGRGAAIVVATGMRTELGRIAGLLEKAALEPTPLQRRLGELGRVLVFGCLAIVAAISALELLRGGSPWDVLLRSVSLAVAAVPEGLPAVVTLVLALGVQRMAARNVLVRRLPSVETLGSVTVIGSDKTGTLTRNEMTVRTIVTTDREYHVSGTGYAPRGCFTTDGIGGPFDPRSAPDLLRVLTIGARCNNASVRPARGEDRWVVVGDPTEGALVVAAMKAGIETGDGDVVVCEYPFDPERKVMSVVVRRADGSRVMYTKGAPEAVLARCTHEAAGAGAQPLSDERRHRILDGAALLAANALRVLGVAWMPAVGASPPDGIAADPERRLVFCGLVGMIDPPRDEARVAVETCLAAGIRPIMITGDHPSTALAIARELGIAGAAGCVATGQDIDALSSHDLAAEAGSISVYARVSAEQKVRIVEALRCRGEVVAMTGDGVNDAPAIRAADIGIAMGRVGTDVTREASDMVLTDDNFASIVAAVEEGRGIYDNIRKFIHYLLACNAGEVLVMLAAAVVGWPAPLAAIQILWLNLITDGLPALALGLEPPEPGLMRRRPRPVREPVVTWARGWTIVCHGTLLAAAMLGSFWVAWGGDESRLPHARAVVFCVAAFAQLLFAFACRSDRRTAWSLGLFANPMLVLAVVVSALLHVSVVMLPFARPVFEVGTELGADWILVLAAAAIPFAVVEAAKARRPRQWCSE
ncbi:MAG: cation-translocating P-type ATPase [Planctomycetia bacterium]|nr:cation-translocating P-type ATPase [Planctomycetia bacterium]